MGGLQRQPCNPDFIQARDAILETDKALFNGANQCEISSGFAKRGLGAGASMQAIADDQTVLPGCTLQTN